MSGKKYVFDESKSKHEALSKEELNELLQEIAAEFVPQTRKINNKALTADVNITAADIGAFPIPEQLSTDTKTYESSDSSPTYNYTMPFTLAKGDCIAYQITIQARGGSSADDCNVNIKRPAGGNYLDTNLYTVVAGGTTQQTINVKSGDNKTISGYLYRVS